jgi:hypothetical protein
VTRREAIERALELSQKAGLRSEGRAANEEESRQAIPNRELRPPHEKTMFPDASEQKNTRVNKYDRDR